ncbi:hypothetical protein QPK13_22945 [Photorhabdus tasmaniensis]
MIVNNVISQAIAPKFVLNLTLRVKRDDPRDESTIIDKVCDHSLAQALKAGLPCGDAMFNTGGPAHDPYFQAWSSDLTALQKLGNLSFA